MTNNTSTRLLPNGLRSEQIQAVRLLPVLVLGSEIEIEHMTNY